MSERAAYSRVYWSIIDDQKFEHVYDDDRALAAWLRLLLVADQAWPASAHLPGNIRRQAVAVLVSSRLIDLQSGGRYRIHGLDAERTRRKEAATRGPNPTGPQPGPNRDPNGLRTTGLRRDETSRDETSRDEGDARGSLDGETEVITWLARHGCALSETNGLRRKLVTLVERFGADAVVGKFDRLSSAGVLDGDARGFVFGAEDALFPKPDLKGLEREERAEEAAEKFNRGVERTQREIARIRGESA